MGPGTVDPNALIVPASDIAFGTGTGTGLDVRSYANSFVENQSVLEPIYFDFNRTTIKTIERTKVKAAAKWLQHNPGKRLVLIGRCDWRGTAEYNLGLGDRRANAVKTSLLSIAPDLTRIETLSKGSTEAKKGGSKASWAKDRRVDFVELKYKSPR